MARFKGMKIGFTLSLSMAALLVSAAALPAQDLLGVPGIVDGDIQSLAASRSGSTPSTPPRRTACARRLPANDGAAVSKQETISRQRSPIGRLPAFPKGSTDAPSHACTLSVWATSTGCLADLRGLRALVRTVFSFLRRTGSRREGASAWDVGWRVHRAVG